MKSLFLSGSRRVSRLAPDVRHRLAELLAESPRILVGDANGADKAFQEFLFERHYPNVIVFSTLTRCRNNIGNWPVQHVEPPHRARDFAFFTAKDEAMALHADQAFMLWDGKSVGTMVNAARVLASGRPAVVWVAPQRTFQQIVTRDDLERLLALTPQKDRARIDRQISEHVDPSAVQPAQARLF
jgi:hypothetical protein